MENKLVLKESVLLWIPAPLNRFSYGVCNMTHEKIINNFTPHDGRYSLFDSWALENGLIMLRLTEDPDSLATFFAFRIIVVIVFVYISDLIFMVERVNLGN